MIILWRRMPGQMTEGPSILIAAQVVRCRTRLRLCLVTVEPFTRPQSVTEIVRF